MTKFTTVSLESFRLTNFASGLACYICGQLNPATSPLCQYCQAPMALAQQAASQKLKPKLIGVVGPSASGKTAYLGMLSDMMSRHHDQLKLVPRGAFSISLQQTTVAALRRCRFPDKTPVEPECWNWMHCQLLSNKRCLAELVLPDLSGQAVLDEIDAQKYPAIRAFLTKCDAVLMLIDAARLASGDNLPDFQAMKVISYLFELNGHSRRGWPNRPVALVFSKTDEAPACLQNPVEFAHRYTPGLWQVIEQRLKQYRFFATSIVGATAYTTCRGKRLHVPLRIEPRGVIEPFAWLVEQLR